MSSFGGTYSTGTVSLVNSDATATFVGSLLSTQATEGDLLFFPSLGILAYVLTVTDDTHIEMSNNWALSNQTGIAYVLIKNSWTRYDPAATQQKTRDMLAYFEAAGFFYFVSGATPDPSLGSDGQWALKVNGGDWQVWYHTGGIWVEQSSPTGIDLQGEWSAIVTYSTNQSVSWQGKLWKSKVNSNLNYQPDLNPTQWLLILSGGDQYDLNFFDTDRPASDELVHKAYFAGVTFYVGLTTSYATAEVASTGTVFFSFQKNNVEFGRLTFSPGNVVGVFTCPTQTTFGVGDKYTMIAPAIRDETLSGVGGNLVGYR